MKTIDAKQCTAIALGRLGENDYTVVRFDVSAWLNELPGAVIGLYNQRPGDADAYPIAAIAVEDGVATWTVTSAELTQTGEGRCELVAIAGEVMAKSAIFRTMVFDALDGSGEVPEPWEEWQQQLIILKGEAEQAADRAEEAVEHYPRINNGVWEVWDGTTEQWVSTGVQAQGPQGEPGEQGETGEPGPQGETGPQGEPGADGVTFTPAVSAEGVISWTNDGGLPNPQPVNIKGPQGDDYILTAADKEEIAQQAAESLAPALDEKAHVIYCEASGAIASFTDGAEDMPVKQLTVNVEPVQDLHGYDHPWPGGGGVNKLNPAEMYCTSSTYGLTATIDGEEFVFSGTYTGTIDVPQFRFARYTDDREIPYKVKGFAMDSATSAHYIGFIGKADGNATLTIQFRNCVQGETYNFRVRIVAYEGDTAPTEWTPYSNICHISGWTGAKVTRTGKNLYDKSTYPFKQYSQYNQTVCWTDPIYLKRGTYTFLSTSGFGRCYITTYKTLADATANTNRVDQYNFANGDPYTQTINADVYVRYQQNNTGGTEADYEKVSQSWQTELGSTASAYTPYSGTTIPISWQSAGTVYGGSLNVMTGVLTVDRAQIASYNGETLPGEWISDRDVYAAGTTPTTGAQVVYELATPITYTLTPQEIRTLLGTNNIWADTGPIDAEYRADTKMYIDNKITQAIAAALNSAD